MTRVITEVGRDDLVLILGIETASDQVGCAIGGHEGTIAQVHLQRARRHVETLNPAIELLLTQSGIALSEISCVAVDTGPGLFTGLRVGLSAGKAIAHALGIPMIGVSSLDLLAFGARLAPKDILACLDARRGEVFCARYRSVPGGVQRISEPRVAQPEDLVAGLIAGSDVLAVGDGALRYRDVLTESIRTEIGDADFAFPSASALVNLAHARALREEFVHPSEIAPNYLRKPDVDVAWEANSP